MTSTRTGRGRAGTIALWTLQILIGVFFIVASALPKFIGESTAVHIFAEIGIGQWFRYLVGALELAGGIGLFVPRLAGLAACGLILLMVGAALTQVFILHDPVVALTPVILGLLLAVVAWLRRDEVRGLFRSAA